jgi:hypothetical protein
METCSNLCNAGFEGSPFGDSLAASPGLWTGSLSCVMSCRIMVWSSAFATADGLIGDRSYPKVPEFLREQHRAVRSGGKRRLPKLIDLLPDNVEQGEAGRGQACRGAAYRHRRSSSTWIKLAHIVGKLLTFE